MVNKANSISRALLFLNSQPLSGAILLKIKACTFIYIPSMCKWAVKALAIFRGRAGSSELCDRYHNLQSIYFLVMYVRLCVHYTGNELVGPCAVSTRRDRLNSLLKCFIFEEFDVFD